MNLSFSPYELVPKGYHTCGNPYKPREGALIRVVFADGLVGYADCHPWPELGDLPLKEQLKRLGEGRMTSLTARSLAFAKIDAQARAQGVSLWKGLAVPESHLLVTSFLAWDRNHLKEACQQGFKRIKIKIGFDLLKETEHFIRLTKGTSAELCKFRLDFNSKLTKQAFEMFLKAIGDAIQWVDFIEDPFPYHPEDWRTFQERYRVSLACDHHSEQSLRCQGSQDVIVIKPAVQDESLFEGNSVFRRVVTSYLDHPLGQLAAAYVASRRNDEIHGLLSHLAYEENPFSKELKVVRARLHPLEGKGFGFDRLLENETWQKVTN